MSAYSIIRFLFTQFMLIGYDFNLNLVEVKQIPITDAIHPNFKRLDLNKDRETKPLWI